MGRIESLIERAKKYPKRIVLPEIEDERVAEAARRIEKEGIAHLISTGKADKKKLVQAYYELQKNKGMTVEAAGKALDNPLYAAAMMVRLGEADSFVAGAAHTSKDVIIAAMQCLGRDRSVGAIFGAFFIEAENRPNGENGFFAFADCAVIPMPSSRQLSRIAISSADLLTALFKLDARIALLTYSTSGSAEGESIDRVKNAVTIIKEKRPDLLVDGELQFDAAIIPDVQKFKAPDSPLKGKANILIFPNLDAANITYKAVERLGNARAMGPTLVGLKTPCSDLSRGCSVDDIIATVALTSARVHLDKK
ncbi:MAG: phosphate acetyltransferase [Candidatus Omnitrophica bacterium]|nr:phosphate acetyltransferase [Candidatus Omnitrophota bacterium]